MKKALIAILLLTAASSQAGIVRFAAKQAYRATKATAKGTVKAGKLAVKVIY
jgi:hypothetical protein